VESHCLGLWIEVALSQWLAFMPFMFKSVVGVVLLLFEVAVFQAWQALSINVMWSTFQ
jgi:ABC-type uncharacterized transport system permease subunit